MESQPWQYKPNYAQTYADERHKDKNKQVKFNKEVEQFVREKLSQEWSPDQISGYAERHNLFSISHERIYQFILKDKEKDGKLYLHLRHQNKKYRKRYGSPKREFPIKNRKFIEDRPKIVNDKISRELKTDFYFAHPYASWERGLNENTNGLIRQYLKKGCDFNNINDEDLIIIMDRLNNRPRKSLNYATPNEIFK